MPDTISRIKLEAQGADQAAREIRKLKTAFEEVANAAKGAGFAGGGGVDPFTKATSGPGGPGNGGGGGGPATNPSASPSQRHVDDDRWRSQVSQRQNANLLGFTKGGISAVEQYGAGQTGSAVGGVASGLGALLKGPWGIGLAVAGTAAYATQKLANTEFDRISRIWGSGMSQRLGRNYGDIRDWEIGMGMQGVNLEQVQQFLSVGSQTGVNTEQKGISNAASMAMEALTALGLDPGTSATLLGTLSRSGVGVTTAGGGMYASGKGAFGEANLGVYIQELTRSIQTLSEQGIDITPQGFADKQGFLAGLGVFGGMNVNQATAVNQMIESKGISAAKLQTPEDLLVLQELRAGGMSITEAQLAMERDPTLVMRSRYERNLRRFGAGSDALNLSMMDVTGGTASSTQDLIQFFERTRGMTPDQIREETEKLGTGWRGVSPPEQAITSARQLQLLQGLEASALELTTSLAGLAQIFTGKIRLNALDITFGGDLPGRFIHDSNIQTEADRMSEDLNIRYLSNLQFASGKQSWDLSKVNPATINWDETYEGTAYGLLRQAYKHTNTMEPEEQVDARKELIRLQQMYLDSLTIKDSTMAVETLNDILNAIKALGITLDTDGPGG